ncbi:hypothetical protein [Amycolatopsis samaneae]|uniref:Peptidase inhibitor family I36 n=1 Tax=Amycolatopsis samaneae TaxID=664691 RepID=A0ABW5G842_9PSEU
MDKLRVVLVGAAVAAGMVLPAVAAEATESAPVRAAAAYGCPDGDVCIYPGPDWNDNRPEHKYYKYGTYNVYNMYGVHRIFNNQTGGATMRTCTGKNGVGCEGYLPAGWYIDKDMTPINSITLQP